MTKDEAGGRRHYVREDKVVYRVAIRLGVSAQAPLTRGRNAQVEVLGRVMERVWNFAVFTVSCSGAFKEFEADFFVDA